MFVRVMPTICHWYLRQFTLWYFDRTALIRTVPFDFGKDGGVAQLALVLYALSECDMCRAGFLPYLHSIKLPEPEHDARRKTPDHDDDNGGGEASSSFTAMNGRGTAEKFSFFSELRSHIPIIENIENTWLFLDMTMDAC